MHARTAAILVVMAGAAACTGAHASGFPAYTIYNLGTLGGTASSGNAITPAGVVAGNSNPTGDQTTLAVVWAYGEQVALPGLGGSNSAIEWPQRSNTALSGIAETGAADPLNENWSCSFFFPSVTHQVCSAFRFANDTITALPALGGVNSYGAGIDARGDIVGWAETAVHDPTCVAPQVLQFEAVRWDARNVPHVLAPLAGDSSSASTAINDLGVAVGISGACDVAFGNYTARHAVFWVEGVPVQIRTFGGKGWNTAASINARGDIAGFADLPGDVVNGQLNFDPVAFISRNGGAAHKILPLSGDTNSIAYDINDSDVVVGQSFGGTEGGRAFVWRNGTGADLNGLVGGGDTSLYLLYAEGINAAGYITGQACVMANGACTGTLVAYLAVPGRGGAAARLAAPAAGVPAALYSRAWRKFGFQPGVTPVRQHGP